MAKHRGEVSANKKRKEYNKKCLLSRKPEKVA